MRAIFVKFTVGLTPCETSNSENVDRANASIVVNNGRL